MRPVRRPHRILGTSVADEHLPKGSMQLCSIYWAAESVYKPFRPTYIPYSYMDRLGEDRPSTCSWNFVERLRGARFMWNAKAAQDSDARGTAKGHQKGIIQGSGKPQDLKHSPSKWGSYILNP